jgi:dihydroflavonol-4-reductase
MKATVTGATGFLGAQVTRLLSERGDEVRVVYRNPDRLDALGGVEFRRAKADVLDFQAMRRAVRGSEVLFHTAGYVGSTPLQRVWRLNAQAPVIAVEAAAVEGLRRVVVTSTVSAVGLPSGNRPADETTKYPEDWLGLAYPDSKHEGEQAALAAGERHGIEVTVVNPSYLLGVPVNRSQPGETSTRIVANYLRGRLPAVIGSGMNFADVEDVAHGHLLAAERGGSGQRYILGAVNMGWPELIDRIAKLSGSHYPVLVLPREIARVARIREAVGLPGALSVEGYELMAKDWRFSSAKARRELGYAPRAITETLRATIDWYVERIESGAFGDAARSGLSTIADGVRTASRLRLLVPVRVAQGIAGRRIVAGV